MLFENIVGRPVLVFQGKLWLQRSVRLKFFIASSVPVIKVSTYLKSLKTNRWRIYKKYLQCVKKLAKDLQLNEALHTTSNRITLTSHYKEYKITQFNFCWQSKGATELRQWIPVVARTVTSIAWIAKPRRLFELRAKTNCPSILWKQRLFRGLQWFLYLLRVVHEETGGCRNVLPCARYFFEQ